MADAGDDCFELYDLRVEVIGAGGRRRSIAAPSPATISSCAARCCILPPGQGFSIYSLAAVLPLLAGQAAADAIANDWMTTDAEIACPDPNCRPALRITRTGLRRFSHAETTAVPLDAETDACSASGSRPATRSRASSAAAGRWPAAMAPFDRRRAGRRHGRLRRCRHHHLRLRRHLYRRRGADRRLPRSATATLRGEAALARIQVHTKFVPDLDMLPRARPRPMSRRVIDRSLQRLRMERLDLVQFHWWDYAVPRLARGGRLARRAAARPARSTASARTNFDTDAHRGAGRRPACRWSPCRCSIRCSTAAPEQAMAAAAAASAACRCSATARSPAASSSDRWLGRARAGGAAREPLADQIQADHRRFRRLGSVPGAAARRCARIADRHGSDIATVASAAMLARPGVAAVIVGARNRAHLAANLRDFGSRARRGRTTPRSTRCWRRASRSRATSTRSSATAAGRHGSIMKYNLNKGAPDHDARRRLARR